MEITKTERETFYDGLVVSGSSTKGFCALGAITKIYDQLPFIKFFSGTSSGSLITCLLAAGYSPTEIFLTWDPEIDPFKNLRPTNTGILSLDRLCLRLSEMLERKGIVYFSDYKDKKVYVCATLFSEVPRPEYFCSEKFPNLKVVDAIKASCSIPGIFPPVEIGGKLYVDGAISDNFPIFPIKEQAFSIRGYRVVPRMDTSPKNIFESIQKAITCMIMNADKGKENEIEKYTEISVDNGLLFENMFLFGKNFD